MILQLIRGGVHEIALFLSYVVCVHKWVCVSAAFRINLRSVRDEMLPGVLPNKQGSAHVHVE